jgi:signal transduction histidine kinase
VEAQTYRLNLLVNDLLNLSSLRSGKLPLQIAPCDVCLLCRNVVEDQRALVDHLIDLKLPHDPLILQADEGRLSQVVINLVVNAIKYSPPDSIVCVDVSLKGTLLILAVHNNGSVIPQEQQENIFEPFYRTREAQTSATQGWGLGLAISKEIVEQHGGRLWVESSEEKGTTFFVALPLHYFSGADSSEMP